MAKAATLVLSFYWLVTPERESGINLVKKKVIFVISQWVNIQQGIFIMLFEILYHFIVARNQLTNGLNGLRSSKGRAPLFFKSI